MPKVSIPHIYLRSALYVPDLTICIRMCRSWVLGCRSWTVIVGVFFLHGLVAIFFCNLYKLKRRDCFRKNQNIYLSLTPLKSQCFLWYQTYSGLLFRCVLVKFNFRIRRGYCLYWLKTLIGFTRRSLTKSFSDNIF